LFDLDRSDLTLLARAVGPRRAHLARDFSYLHLPLVAGVVFIAVGLESVMSHPLEHMHGVYAVALGGGAALFLFGLSAVSGCRGHRPRLDHLIGGVVCLCLIPASIALPGVVALVLLVLVLVVVAVVDRSRGRSESAAPDRLAEATTVEA
jgi:low temperature requirement protein LtrA